MSIVFFGTPEWAIPSLKAVIESGIEVSAVFTQPDRRVGRKRELTPSPVKLFALEQNLAVHAPENAGSKDTLELVRAMSPELILVCAYGQILTHQFLNIPVIGCFNLHFSFLPSLRGASPVQTAIASGLKQPVCPCKKLFCVSIQVHWHFVPKRLKYFRMTPLPRWAAGCQKSAGILSVKTCKIFLMGILILRNKMNLRQLTAAS